MPSRYLQIHTLSSYPATRLNCDETGAVKRLTLGGVPRLRVSSACLKHRWRQDRGPRALTSLDVPLAVRSRAALLQGVYGPLLAAGVAAPLAEAATRALRELIEPATGEGVVTARGAVKAVPPKGRSAKRSGGGVDPASGGQAGLLTERPLVVGPGELEAWCRLVREACAAVGARESVGDEVRRRFAGAAGPAVALRADGLGVDVAMFGRPARGNLLPAVPAAVQVGHAFTVHAAESDLDVTRPADDLAPMTRVVAAGDPTGASGRKRELTSGLYYGYVVIDVPTLIANLEGCPAGEWRQADRTLAGTVVENLIHLIATITPGARVGSTAPYAYASLILVEAGDLQPRTLANGFLTPVAPTPNLLNNAYDALAWYLSELDTMYECEWRRAVAALAPTPALSAIRTVDKIGSLQSVALWAANQVRAG